MQTRFLTNPFLYELIEDYMMDRSEFEGVMSAITLIAYESGMLENEHRATIIYRNLCKQQPFCNLPKKRVKEIFDIYLSFVPQEAFRERMKANVRSLDPETKSENMFLIRAATQPIEMCSGDQYSVSTKNIEALYGKGYGNIGDV